MPAHKLALGRLAAGVLIFLANGSVVAQCQQAKLTAGDATSCSRCGDAFGISVSIDGDFIAVAAPDGLPSSSPNGIPGATYIFRRDGVAWNQQAKLIPTNAQPEDGGGKVSISGNRVLMGVASQDGFTGAAYIFLRQGTTWEQETVLTATDADPGDTFGIGICLRGDVAVVGAWGDDEAGPNAGAAYVFRRDNSGTPLDPGDDVWTQEAKLIPNDPAAGDLFGIDCSISGNHIVVGATQCNPGLRCGLPGKAYLFRRDGSNWVQAAKLTASDGAPDDNFGGRVGIDGDAILIGAWFHDSACPTNPECNSGAVYFFKKPVGGWVDATETVKLTAGDTGQADNFGKSVALRGDLTVIGADLDDEAGPNAGAAYVFRREQDLWIEKGKLTANDPELSDRLGFSVSLSRGRVVAGAFNNDDACPTDPSCNSGSAYVFGVNECIGAACGTLLVQVNERRVGSGGSTIVGIDGLELCVFEKSASSCARNIGISRRRYPEIFTTCEPIVCETTAANGSVSLHLEAGDYVLIGEYDPDGFPPNDDGDERFIGVSAGSFACAANGDPNTVSMRKHLQVIILPNGRTVRVNPRAGSRSRIAANDWIEITNVEGPDDSIFVTAVDEDVPTGADPYAATGTAIGIDSSLSSGQLFMTIIIPLYAEDLVGSEPLTVDLTHYNPGTLTWELAVGGNAGPSPGHGLDVIGDRFAVADTTIPLLSNELGDHGVFWNPDLEEGFAWANVDYTGEFANARQPQSGVIPTVSAWGLLALAMLLLIAITVVFGRQRRIVAV